MLVPVLNGRNVILRGVTLDDVDAWLAGEDEEQIRWFEFPRKAQRIDVVRAITAWNDSNAITNLSYLVFPAWRRRGFALEATSLAVKYAAEHLGVRTVALKILEGNVASLRTAARLGAIEVGSERSEAGGTLIVHHLDTRIQ
jgi:L-amino acid N-acyltransferase YncA